MSNSYIYIISFEDPAQRRLTPYAKIGKTYDIRSRLIDLQIGSPFRLKVFGYFESDNPDKSERYLHKSLKKYNVSGEWFLISNEMIEIIQTRFYLAENNLTDLIVQSDDTPEKTKIRKLESHIAELNQTISNLKILVNNLERNIESRDVMSNSKRKKSFDEFKWMCTYKQ